MGLFDRARARRGTGKDGPTPPKAQSIYVGRYYDDATEQAGGEIPYSGERHILVFGPSGCGKGTRFLVPNLLNGLNDCSVVVIDPKGELAAITADHRRKLGHDVVILNPFNELGLGSAGFNPLANMDPNSPKFFEDAAGIGEALIQIAGQEPHWSESAQGLITGLVMWEKKFHRDEANLENVRMMLTESDDWIEEEDADGKKHKRKCAGLTVTAQRMVKYGGYEIESLAGRFTGENDELSGIRSSADTQTRWLLSPMMRADLSKNGINFANLKTRPTTVYVILPAEQLSKHSVWLRLVIVTALRSLYRPGGLRTVMLIDETAALGHLKPLEDAFGLVRGFRVQIAVIFQDLTQLKALYKERWETFTANAGVVMGFTPNDLTTADWMSKRSGQDTILAKGFSENTGLSTGQKATLSAGSGLSDQQVARPLFLPQELMGFEKGMGLLWLEDLPYPAKFFAPSYWKIRACQARARDNPYHTG